MNFSFVIKIDSAQLQVFSIGSVCTHDEYRGQGIAGKLLDLCKQHADASGASLIFISGGRSLYTRAQCFPFGQTKRFALDAESAVVFNSFEGKETIKWYSIYNSSFTTNRGITIGSTRDEVINAYGSSYYNFFNEKSSISFGEKTGMKFDLNNNKVQKITVWFVYE